MIVSSAFRRVLVAVALLSAAMAAFASPASARSRHVAYRHAHAHYAFHHVRRHVVEQRNFSQFGYPRYSSQAASFRETSSPQVAYRARSRTSHDAALARLRRYAHTQASVAPSETSTATATSGSS